MLSKNLIFYWYIPKGNIMPDIYYLHLYNLKKYAKKFTSATFILGIDDLSNTISIKKTKEIIESIGFSCKIDYLLYKNDTDYRECISFYNELVAKLKYLQGPTFYAHSKGYTRTLASSTVPLWCAGLWYFNLNDIKAVDSALSKKDIYAYGVFKKEYDWVMHDHDRAYKQKFGWHYSGTFFWIDPQKIYKYIVDNNIDVSMDLHRWYAEMFLGNIFDQSHAYTKYKTLHDENLYTDCNRLLKERMEVPDKELNGFYKYFNSMTESIKNEYGIHFKEEAKFPTISKYLNFENPNYIKKDVQTGLKKLIFR